MLNTFKLLQSLDSKGISVSLVDGFLKVVPKELLNDELRAEIRTHKSELVSALLIAEPVKPQEGIEAVHPSCWHCLHYDGRGAAWPGMCRHCEKSGHKAKEIDFNAIDPDKGCRFFLKAIQGARGAAKIERPGVHHTKSATSANKRREAVKLPSRVALDWLAKNRQALLRLGWTTLELYRRNKSRGVAWLLVWNKPGLQVDLTSDGVIKFIFPSTRGTVKQTAKPQKPLPMEFSNER